MRNRENFINKKLKKSENPLSFYEPEAQVSDVKQPSSVCIEDTWDVALTTALKFAHIACVTRLPTWYRSEGGMSWKVH